MFELFTDRVRKVMALANQDAQRLKHEYTGTEHILLALVNEGSGVGANVLKILDVDLSQVRHGIEELVNCGPRMIKADSKTWLAALYLRNWRHYGKAFTHGKLPLTPQAKKVIKYALEEMRNLNHNYAGTEHLLLGLLNERDGVAAEILTQLNVELDEVREEVLNMLGGGVGPEHAPAIPSTGNALVEDIERRREMRERIQGYAELEDKIESLLIEKDEAVRSADYERAADLRDDADRLGKQLAQLVEDF